MKFSGIIGASALATIVVTSAQFLTPAKAQEEFTLARAIPNDVFIYEGRRKRVEREFLDRYWGEVFEAAKQSGIAEDVIELFGTAVGLDEEQAAEMARLKQRMTELLAGVDWAQLEGEESAFAERFVPPKKIARGQPTIMMANLVWLARGPADGTARNFAGLVSILDAIVEETNLALGREALVVQRRNQAGTEIARVNLLAVVPGAPELPVAVAWRDDILLIALREDLCADVLELLSGGSEKKSLADDPRFQAAFAELPAAEDSIAFFDMQALVKPMRSFFDTLFDEIVKPRDVYRNTGKSEEVSKLTARAMAAYQRGDIGEALAVSKQAQEIGPDDAIVLYNLACFNALLGNREEALGWLEKAVDGGFYAPRKMGIDPDLASLRDDPKYLAAVTKATNLARECCAEDVAINCSNTGEVMGLRLQVRQAYAAKDYEGALKLAEQAAAVAPKDSQVMYILGCLHARLGHEDTSLELLEKAVAGGFYCPQHVSQDSDWDGLRDLPRYKAAVTKASNLAAEEAARSGGTKARLVTELVGRSLTAMEVLDYAATVGNTEGYSVQTESRVTLIQDAPQAAIYPVFGNRPQQENFQRYLPKETASFSVSTGFDLDALYGFLEESYERAGPLGNRLLARWAMLQDYLGIDVRRDVLDWIEGGSISMTLANRGGSVLLLKVTDEPTAREKVELAFTALPEKIMAAIRTQPKLAPLAGFAAMAPRTMPLEHAQLEGFQAIQLGFSPQRLGVWGVADGYLIFGTSPDAVALCLATGRGDHPNIRQSEEALKDMILPEGPFTRVSLTDREGPAQDQAVAIGFVGMMTGMLVAAAPDPELRPVLAKISSVIGKIGPIVAKVDFYKSAATCTTFDGQTWHSRSVTHYLSPEERAAKAKQ